MMMIILLSLSLNGFAATAAVFKKSTDDLLFLYGAQILLLISMNSIENI